MAIAQELATHPWRPFAGNILHGKDKAGILVNTPDAGHEPQQPRKGWWVPGEVNDGIPYKWGGFDDPASFDAAVANGLAGGRCLVTRKTPGRQCRRQRPRGGRGLLGFRFPLPETADGA